MQKTLDIICEFENNYSKCHLRVFETPGQISIVIVTELAGNPGTTIINAAGYLAAMIYERIDHPLDKMIWFEHHRAGEGSVEGAESFDRVLFGTSPPVFNHPQRYSLTRTDVEVLIGQQLA